MVAAKLPGPTSPQENTSLKQKIRLRGRNTGPPALFNFDKVFHDIVAGFQWRIKSFPRHRPLTVAIYQRKHPLSDD